MNHKPAAARCVLRAGVLVLHSAACVHTALHCLLYCLPGVPQYHLKRCGLRYVYYLVEGDPDTLPSGGRMGA